MSSTNPDHYIASGLEVIDIIEAYNLDFASGNAVKYILRAGKKNDEKLDFKKARWYITHKLRMLGESAQRIADKKACEYANNEDFKKFDAFYDGFKAAYEHLGLRFEET